MPFFWVGGFGSGVLSALLSGATLVTEGIPQPETTLRLLERERVTLFRGWPDQAEALARQADSVGADLSGLCPGSLDALLPPDQRAQPGARAKLFGMTEAFGPYCGYPADTDMPRSARGSCGKPFDGMEVRIVTNVPGEQGGRVGAAIVCDTTTTTTEQLRNAARNLLSAFKVPTVWLLADSDDAIPRGSTGKVDVRRLREMFAGR